MAPPRRADKGKAVATASPSKRARVCSGSEANGYDDTLFRSQRAYEFYSNDINTRRVHFGKRIDFEFFHDAGFDLKSVFDALGWADYVAMDEVIYPHLVSLFYANLAENSKKKLITYVKGVEIPLKVSMLSEVMEISIVPGVRYADHLEDRSAALNRILGTANESYGLERVNANSFPAYHRFLHNIVCSILTPRGGSMQVVTDDHILLINALIDGTHVDLPNITLKYILDVISMPKRRLLYGMLITRILKKFKVNLAGEECKSLTCFDIIDGSTLSRMRMTIKDRSFVRTGSRTPQKGQCSQADEDGDDFAQCTPSSSRKQPNVDSISQMFTKLGTDLNAQFDSLDHRLDALYRRFGSLETKVDSLTSEVYLLKMRQEKNAMLDNHLAVKKEF